MIKTPLNDAQVGGKILSLPLGYISVWLTEETFFAQKNELMSAVELFMGYAPSFKGSVHWENKLHGWLVNMKLFCILCVS